MKEALVQSRYEVATCGINGAQEGEPTGNRITAAIKKSLREAPVDGTLILYFTGHGVVVDGKSWLVPKDAYVGADGLDTEGLIPLIPRGLEQCRASLVLYIVDACRNDLSASLTEPPRGGDIPYLHNGNFVMINSCASGQRSLYNSTGSYFTQVLSETLSRRSPSRTLGEVEKATREQVARLAARSDHLRQTPETISANRDLMTTPVADIVICEGDRVSETWRKAVDDSPLWQRLRLDEQERGEVQSAVRQVVDRCASSWVAQRDKLAEYSGLIDPWSTPDYPVRLLGHLEQLLPQNAELSRTEVAAAIAAPFIREAAIGAGLRIAADIKPHDFTRSFADGPRSDLEITHSMHEHVWRRAEGMARRQQTDACNALSMWLVHRWLAGRTSIWDEPEVLDLIKDLALRFSKGAGMTHDELCDQIAVIAQSIDPVSNDETSKHHLTSRLFDRRLRTLGALLWLAGVLAFDPRRMPSVIVDHIGVTDELTLPALHTAIAEAEWHVEGDELFLKAVCMHPAIYTVFEGHIARGRQVAETVRGMDIHSSIGSRLPKVVTGKNLRPARKDGVPVFDTPVPAFRLSTDKVRELLMGRQLYGEPDLAIRELYQNALDACRYRRTRREYRTRLHRGLSEWSPAIIMYQGVDRGRPYVECSDNGVGMSRETLMNTFANAGERFVYQPAFRDEQARWQSQEPPIRLIPNSQFGVGVFSYFMIAEEIVITTRSTDPDDVPAKEAHQVRIASSGSLFQITACDGPPSGGTTVRLYLTGEDPISILRTMRRLLWVAEFDVRVSEQGESTETWEAEVLRYPGASAPPLKHGRHLWWVAGKGGLAADGLRTNEERYGLVVNLREQRRPQFTVDRNRLRRWDTEWVSEQVRESLPHLESWPGLTLNWIWKVTEKTPAVAEEIFKWLAQRGHQLPVQGSWAHGIEADASQVGCLPVDLDFFNGELRPSYDNADSWLLAWRIGVWSKFVRFYGMERVPEVNQLDGFPVARPMDSAVLDEVYEAGYRRYRSPSRYGQPSIDDLLILAANEDEAPTLRLKRLRRYAITGLSSLAGRGIPPIGCRFHDDDRPPTPEMESRSLIYAVAAWAGPGQERKRAVGGWLSLASNTLNVPLKEVLRRVSALVPSTWTPPGPSGLPEELLGHVFDSTEVSLFSQGLYSGPPWVDSVISPSHLVRVSGKLGVGIQEVLGRFERFRPLGYEVASYDSYPPELQPVEVEALEYVHVVGRQLTHLEIFVLSGRADMSVTEVHNRLQRLAGVGLLALPNTVREPEARPTQDERVLIYESLTMFDRRLYEQVLARDWLAVRLILGNIGPREFSGFADRLTQAQRLLRVIALDRAVTMPELVDLAYLLDIPVREATAHFRLLFGNLADLSELPPAAYESEAACHRVEEVTALLGTWQSRHFGDHGCTWQISAANLAAAASIARQAMPAFLERLSVFRDLGAPIPTLDVAALAVLADHPVDKYDVAMLHRTDEFGQDHTIDEIDALWLIQVAARFGWTPAAAHARFVRFEPLGLTVHPQAADCPQAIVEWQDVLILTSNLDGQGPALSGSISEDHVAASAAEIGESSRRVLKRLRPYAKLLGFSLDLIPESDQDGAEK